MRHRNNTSFVKGQTAWNKKEPLEFICQQCGNQFEVNYGVLGSRKIVKFCSKQCQTAYQREHSKYRNLIALKAEGKTTAELAEIYKVSRITIGSTLNRLQYRAPLGQSLTTIRKRIKFNNSQKCIICGFKRYVELAHIVKASENGEMSKENTIMLCPNHHRLYDGDKLTKREKRKLEVYLESRRF